MALDIATRIPDRTERSSQGAARSAGETPQTGAARGQGADVGLTPSAAPADSPANDTKPDARPDKGETGADERGQPRRRELLINVWGLARSPLTRLILLANFTGLAILGAAMLVLGETRDALVLERMQLLQTQGEVIRQFVAENASDKTPYLDHAKAAQVLTKIRIDEHTRVRIFDENGAQIVGADSRFIRDAVWETALTNPQIGILERLDHAWRRAPWRRTAPIEARSRSEQIRLVLGGAPSSVAQRIGVQGDRILAVAFPIQRVQAILGVVVVETGDVDALIAAERQALRPVLLVAALVAILSSALLAIWIANPVRRLALSAHRVRRDGPKRAAIPALANRRDEIGDLSLALSAMTAELSQRINDIERFAADVAHELKNPLTSIRSAIETLPVARDRRQYEQLLKVIQNDTQRIDRLITDIARASRVDAELARSRSSHIDLARLLQNLVSMYQAVRREDEPDVLFEVPERPGRYRVFAAEDPLGHVFRNLIDNARTFCPPDAAVRVGLRSATHEGRLYAVAFVEDRGPGVPAENLERIFERFYTSRPRGAAFGSNSGLGLAIARQIVEAHGGRIWAENVHGRQDQILGARFSVALPIDR